MVSCAAALTLDRLEPVDTRDLAARREFAQQDLERGDQAEIAERRRAQVLDDPALQRDAAVQRLVEVGQAFGGVGCWPSRRGAI